MRRLISSALLVTAITLAGCLALPVDEKSHRGHGPPPHAPAHGYRQHHQSADLVSDSKLGVYLVRGHANHFYADGRFLRLHAGSWQVSASLRGPWSAYPSRSLPPGLRSTHPSKAKRGKAGGHPPAKGRW